MSELCPQYKMSLTIATLHPLPWYGIPYPNSHTYLPYAVIRRCGNATLKGFGWPTAVWSWNWMSQAQLYNWLSLFDNDTDASADLYICTYKDAGYSVEYANFLAKVARPLDGNGKTIIPHTRSHFSNVTAQLFHMVEQ